MTVNPCGPFRSTGTGTNRPFKLPVTAFRFDPGGTGTHRALPIARWIREVLLNRDPRFSDGLQPSLDIAVETPLQQFPDRRWRIWGQLLKIDLGAQHIRQRVRHRLAVEQPLPRQHLVQHNSERPHIGAPVGRLARRLLRRHVGSGAHDDAGFRLRHRKGRRVLA